MSTTREAASEESLLYTTGLMANGSGSGSTETRQEQRDFERELYKELSMYHLRAVGLWTRPKLLSRGKRGGNQSTGNIPLTRFPISTAGRGKSYRPPRNSEGVGARSVNTGNGGFEIPIKYPDVLIIILLPLD